MSEETKSWDFALKFDFELKTRGEKPSNDNKENSFSEYFIPYSVSTLIQNGLLSANEEVILSRYSNEKRKEVPLNIPSPVSYLADWINQNGEYEENCLFDYIADFVFVVELAKSDAVEEQEKVKVGILTELIKLQFFQFKIDFSILYAILTDTNLNENIRNNIDAYADILYEIVQRLLPDSDEEKVSLTRDNIANRLRSNPNDLLNFICNQSYSDIQTALVEIYNRNVDEDLLKKLIDAMAKTGNLPKKYKANREGSGCFCIVRNGEKIYFSLSGTYESERRVSNRFIPKIKESLKQEFNMDCEFCPISPEMKAYGMDTELGFQYFPYPQKIRGIFCNIHFFPYCDIRTQSLYACCERKIFVKTQGNTLPIKIHCRWSPCQKCQIAVFEEIQGHESFEYVALAKDFRTFEKTLLADKIADLKLWKLTKI